MIFYYYDILDAIVNLNTKRIPELDFISNESKCLLGWNPYSGFWPQIKYNWSLYYPQNLFQCSLFYYILKFGPVDLDTAIKILFESSYTSRARQKQLEFSGINKYLNEVQVFEIIKQESTPKKVFNSLASNDKKWDLSKILDNKYFQSLKSNL